MHLSCRSLARSIHCPAAAAAAEMTKSPARQRWMDASVCMDGERERNAGCALEHAKAEIARLKSATQTAWCLSHLLRLLSLNAAIHSLIARASPNRCKFHANLLRCDDCFCSSLR
jgi:hypothetical protein